MTESMVADIRLDHLQEYEVQLILAVLERDAEIQRRDEARTRKLQQSIRGERLPKKRLSVKCRTGEWMNELSDQNRTSKEKGIAVVRASIKRKSLSKPKRGEQSVQQREDNKENQEQGLADKKVEDSEAREKNDADASKESTGYAENAGYTTPSNQQGENNLQEYNQPKRKTSFRRKKIPSDKQVKFAPEKTEKFVYETPKAEVENDKEEPDVPTIIIDSLEDYAATKPSAEEEKPSSESKDSTSEKYDEKPQESSYESNKSFESYHNDVGKEIFSSEEQPVGDTAKPVSDVDKPPTPTSKTTKKVKVVKRMGSSRKRGSPKITDDSSRNTVFSRMEYDQAADTNKAKYDDYKTDDRTTKEESSIAYPNTKPDSYVEVTSETITKELDEIAKEEFKKVESNIQAEAEKPSLDKTEEYISSVLENFGSEGDNNAAVYTAATEFASIVYEEAKKEMEPEVPETKYVETKEDHKEYSTEITEVTNQPTPHEDKSEVKKNIVDYLSHAVGGNDNATVEESISKPIEPEVGYVDERKDEYLPVVHMEEKTEPISEENKTCVEIAEVILDSPQKVIGEEGGENESPSSKTKKKVVKKVIKKKAKAAAEGYDMPKPDEEANEGEEERSENKSRLERKKTVRKKVVRKKPPQET